MGNELRIPSVNFHLWEPCNMRCKFCFATFQDVKQVVLPKGHLPREKAIEVVKLLAESGFQKITFAGGEPTLCPWLGELIETAHANGMTTMIVTNGTKLSKAWLSKYKSILDWVALSVDSLDKSANIKSGRAIAWKKALSEEYYYETVQTIKDVGLRLKINTVVSSANWLEDMSAFISYAEPERWKLFQVLPIQGQNDKCINDFIITKTQFEDFYNRHNALSLGIPIIPETNELMTASYGMVDPAGRFFDNSKGYHTYSNGILEVGVEKALSQVSIIQERFIERDGIYDWK